jgi:hypothetical protein
LAENIPLLDEKISPKHESYALTKLTEPPETGFVGFVSSHTEGLGKIFESSDEKNNPSRIEEITQNHVPYALTKLTQPPEIGFVSFVSDQTARLGEFFPLSDGKNDTHKNDNITLTFLLQQMRKNSRFIIENPCHCWIVL